MNETKQLFFFDKCSETRRIRQTECVRNIGNVSFGVKVNNNKEAEMILSKYMESSNPIQYYQPFESLKYELKTFQS